jgi:hypothetical protein
MQNIKTIKILERLRSRGHKIPQLIDTIKRFLLQRLDYSMMNSVIGVTELGELEMFIRNINNEMGG